MFWLQVARRAGQLQGPPLRGYTRALPHSASSVGRGEVAVACVEANRAAVWRHRAGSEGKWRPAAGIGPG